MIDFPVFRLELPLSLAPSMNVYAHLRPWQREKIAKRVDALVMQAKPSWQRWDMGVTRRIVPYVDKSSRIRKRVLVDGGHKRRVVVTRESSRQPDEISVDICGGKIPIDRLVLAGVLRDDSRRWLDREARWLACPPKAGRVVIEVYELD